MEVSVAFVPPGGLLRQIGAGLALLVVTTTAVAGELAIQYDLRPSFAGAETANGRIEVQVRNLSGHPLSALTLRLSNQARGRITGPVQESIDLAAGESRRLEGEFVLDATALASAEPLEWLVIYDDAAGFAHQETVRGTAVGSVAAHASVSTVPQPDADQR
jgi:hypothetical protein